MNQFIRNLVLVVMLFSYPLTMLADATARPKANNKLGISKKTQEEKDRFDSALRRKQLSLVLAGKLKPEDATELKNALFPKLK